MDSLIPSKRVQVDITIPAAAAAAVTLDSLVKTALAAATPTVKTVIGARIFNASADFVWGMTSTPAFNHDSADIWEEVSLDILDTYVKAAAGAAVTATIIIWVK